MTVKDYIVSTWEMSSTSAVTVLKLCMFVPHVSATRIRCRCIYRHYMEVVGKHVICIWIRVRINPSLSILPFLLFHLLFFFSSFPFRRNLKRHYLVPLLMNTFSDQSRQCVGSIMIMVSFYAPYTSSKVTDNQTSCMNQELLHTWYIALLVSSCVYLPRYMGMNVEKE